MFDDQNNSAPFQDAGTAKAEPPIDLPESDQEEVKPKFGREISGTEDIFSNTEEMPQGLSAMPSLNSLNNQPSSIPQHQEEPKIKPVTPTPPEPLSKLPDDLEEEGGSKKFFWIGLVVLIIILGAGGYFVYGKFFAPEGQNLPLMNFVNNFLPSTSNGDLEAEIDKINSNDNVDQNTDEMENPIIEEEVFEEPIIEEENNEYVDCPEYISPEFDFCEGGQIVYNGDDENGCPLPPECIITEIDQIDSDGDGLTDNEELQFGTDPAESDTDGDNLFDFEEIYVYETDPLDPDTDGDGYTDGSEVQGGYNPNGEGMLLDLNFEE